jgi:quercetin dioxygenase-like cupin family protein
MKKYHFSEIESKQVTDYGSAKTNIRVLISPETAPNFIMRRFEIGPGGNIGVHEHWNEHEIYVIEGSMDLIDKNGDKTHVMKDDFIFMPGDEPHGYKNDSDKKVVFLCVIPKKKE